MSQRTFTTRLRVRYAETDQMGVVYHGNYFAWFEMGRSELMRELGVVYSRLEAEEGMVLPVVDVQCRYRSPARYDEELELETCLRVLRGPMVKFAYQLFRSEPTARTLLAEALTTHVVVDRTSLRSCRLPEKYASVLREHLGQGEGK